MNQKKKERNPNRGRERERERERANERERERERESERERERNTFHDGIRLCNFWFSSLVSKSNRKLKKAKIIKVAKFQNKKIKPFYLSGVLSSNPSIKKFHWPVMIAKTQKRTINILKF